MNLTDGKKLGFGCMRLPVLEAGKPDSFDHEKIAQLFDAFLEQGFTYFDTAYTYHGYEGEKAVKRALVDQHPRDAFHSIMRTTGSFSSQPFYYNNSFLPTRAK